MKWATTAAAVETAATGLILLLSPALFGWLTCDKPLGAVRDTKRSRPDHAVWVLKCSDATYRITRAPDMAAKVEPLL